MIKINYIIILKFYFLNFLLKNKKLNTLLKNLELDFHNLNFEDFNKIKNLYLKISLNYDISTLANEYYFQTFDWLIISKKLGGVKNINIAKKNILNWQQNKNSLFRFAWNIDISAKRLLNLIYFYDYYSQIFNKNDMKLIDKLLNKHFIYLKLQIEILNYRKININLIKVNLLISLILQEDISKLNEKIILYLGSSIDRHGFNKSFNPSYQAEFINSLYEIRNIYLYFQKIVPKEVEFHLMNLTSVLNNLFHKDNSICLFNGSSNFNSKAFAKIINQLGYLKSRDLMNIKNGIVIYNDSKKKLFFDAVKTTNDLINNNLHASTLSIEFSANKEKIISNCGALENRFKKNPEYLRYSAAHSTIIINNTNISELINKSSYKRTPKNIVYDKDENENNIILSCSHDGYLENFGKVIKRKIFISKKNNYISGKDTIIGIKKYLANTRFDIRFHLIPNCKCVLTNSKKSAIIKTQKNNSWIFSFNNVIRIEESILVENGVNIKQNKQIVLTGFAKEIKHIEEWSLKQI